MSIKEASVFSFAGGLLAGAKINLRQVFVPDAFKPFLSQLKADIVDYNITRDFSNLSAPYIRIFNHNYIREFGDQGSTENVLVGMEALDEPRYYDNFTDVLVQVTHNPDLTIDPYYLGWDMDVFVTGGSPIKIFFRNDLIHSYPEEGHYRSIVFNEDTYFTRL